MTVEDGRSGFTYAESPLDKKPHLKLASKVHALHEPVVKSDGTIRHWWDLSEDVQPYTTGLELADNIRSTVYEYVGNNLPRFREKTQSVFPSPTDRKGKSNKKTFSDKELLNAIVHSWSEPFEGYQDKNGHGLEVLVSVASHVVNRIENKMYRDLLKKASQFELTVLGLSQSQRDVLIKLLEITPKADPLFTRFLSFAQLSPDPLSYSDKQIKKAENKGIVLKHATATTFFIPQESKHTDDSKIRRKSYPEQKKFGDTAYTFPMLFPKEATFIANHLQEIVDTPAAWQQEANGAEFREYLQEVASLFHERNNETMQQRQLRVEDLYKKMFHTDFPIILVLPTEGYYKEPYIDPELRIALTTPDTKVEVHAYDRAKHAMAESLDSIGLNQFASSLHNEPIKSAISIGPYGVNTTFNAVAQENPTTLLFLNDQLRAYDRDFYTFMQKITNTEHQFGTMLLKGDATVEFMCRMTTVFHEFSHHPYKFEVVDEKKSDVQKRIGDSDEATEIDEIKADILYRAIIPEIIAKGGLDGTKEQWAIALVASAMQSLAEENDDSAYALNAIYTLNEAYKNGLIIRDGRSFHITDYDDLYATWKKSAKALIAVYEDTTTTPKKVNTWIKNNCRPNKYLRKAIEVLQDDKNKKIS